MSAQFRKTVMFRVLAIGIALVQIFDIIIHVATNQLEAVRVTSNVIILLWLLLMTSGKLNTKFLQTAIAAIGAYLLLNVIFLAVEGVTNVEQGGGLRVVLFLLVFLTVTLSFLLVYLRQSSFTLLRRR
jgi:hypothetical protein